MTTKQFLLENYEKVLTNESGKKVVNVYRPKTMLMLPESFVKDFADPKTLCTDYPVRGVRYETGNPDWGEWDAQVIKVRHGWIVDVYVCSILVRPFSSEADKFYGSHMGLQPNSRCKLMWDSRIFDQNKKDSSVAVPTLNVFKRGDFIVSGYGNIRIFTGECYGGDSWQCLTSYCSSDCPAGTDMRYARHATDEEKKKFIDTVKENGLLFNKRTLEIKETDELLTRDLGNLLNARVQWKAEQPIPYKVIKKRVRATLRQVRQLEKERDICFQNCKDYENDNIELRKTVAKLNDQLKELTEKCKNQLKADEHLAQKVEDLRRRCELADKDLEAANRDCNNLEEELKRVNHANESLSAFNDQYKKRIKELEGRGFWARVFNK